MESLGRHIVTPQKLLIWSEAGLYPWAILMAASILSNFRFYGATSSYALLQHLWHYIIEESR